MGNITKIVLIVLIVIIVAILKVLFPIYQETQQYDEIPLYKELEVNHIHVQNGTHPFAGVAAIDIDGNGISELYVGGGRGKSDVIYDSSLTNIVESTGIQNTDATYSVISLDIDKDEDVDLIISRENGLFLYFNTNGVFTEKKIPIDLETQSIPLHVAPGDINNDGWIDLYISTFVNADNFQSATFNDPSHAKENILLLNNGDNTFTDITEKSGSGVNQNTFISSFVDLNNDNFLDLVVAPNTDTAHIFKNNRDETFTEIKNPTDFGFWMGIAIGDYDNDLDQDIFLSNTGDFLPSFLLRGDLEEEDVLDTQWALLRNDGNFTFTNINEDFAQTEFAFGGVFEDFNLDRNLDLLVGTNYFAWAIHRLFPSSGRLFLQDSEFISVSSNLENPYLTQSPLRMDFNNDGFADIIYQNINGPLRILLHEGSSNHYVKVVYPDSVEYFGGKIKVTQGSYSAVQAIASSGMGTDHSAEAFFGFGSNNEDVTIEISLLNGEVITQTTPVDSIVVI